MVDKGQVARFLDFVKSDGRLLVTTHIFPDGDAIGSLLAMGGMLDELDIEHEMAVDAILPYKYSFLPGFEKIRSLQQNPIDKFFDKLIVLDAGALSRIGVAEKGMTSSTTVFNIDHHFSGPAFGHHNIVIPQASATAEILYDLANQLGLNGNGQYLAGVYVGILTDTGRFRFSNTTGQAMTICANLIDRGVNPVLITDKVYYNYPFEIIRSLGRTIAHAELHYEGRLCLIMQNDLRFSGETEGFVEYAASVEGALLAVLITRIGKGSYKISLRSRCEVDVSEVARRLNGGGHPKAAGFKYSGNRAALRRRVLEELCQEMVKHGIQPLDKGSDPCSGALEVVRNKAVV